MGESRTGQSANFNFNFLRTSLHCCPSHDLSFMHIFSVCCKSIHTQKCTSTRSDRIYLLGFFPLRFGRMWLDCLVLSPFSQTHRAVALDINVYGTTRLWFFVFGLFVIFRNLTCFLLLFLDDELSSNTRSHNRMACMLRSVQIKCVMQTSWGVRANTSSQTLAVWPQHHRSVVHIVININSGQQHQSICAHAACVGVNSFSYDCHSRVSAWDRLSWSKKKNDNWFN